MTRTIVYDVGRRRAGCALLQAAYGGTVSNEMLDRFEDWLISPTPGMRRYRVTDEELRKLIALTNEDYKKRGADSRGARRTR